MTTTTTVKLKLKCCYNCVASQFKNLSAYRIPRVAMLRKNVEKHINTGHKLQLISTLFNWKRRVVWCCCRCFCFFFLHLRLPFAFEWKWNWTQRGNYYIAAGCFLFLSFGISRIYLNQSIHRSIEQVSRRLHFDIVSSFFPIHIFFYTVCILCTFCRCFIVFIFRFFIIVAFSSIQCESV